MKTLHLHLVRQMLLTLVMTVAVFSFVILLVNILREVLMLLVSGQATPELVLKAIGLLVPYVLVWSLPMGMLTATLLVFGRFSADQELTAARASGISVLSLITPILIIAAGLSALSALINMEIAPQCRAAHKALLHDIGVVNLEKISRNLPDGTLIDWIPQRLIYIEKVNPLGEYENVYIYEFDENNEQVRKVKAKRAVFTSSATNDVLKLYDLASYSKREGLMSDEIFMEAFDYDIPHRPPPEGFREKYTEMTFARLREKLAEVERRVGEPITEQQLQPEEIKKQRKQAKKQIDITLPIRMQMHFQVASSFACIGFTLIGIPLGIRAHRRETSIGVAIALGLVLVYYSFMILAEALENRPDLTPQLIFWLPSLLFQLVGAILLWRANRGAF